MEWRELTEKNDWTSQQLYLVIEFDIMICPVVYQDIKGIGVNQIRKVKSKGVNKCCEVDWVGNFT